MGGLLDGRIDGRTYRWEDPRSVSAMRVETSPGGRDLHLVSSRMV